MWTRGEAFLFIDDPRYLLDHSPPTLQVKGRAAVHGSNVGEAERSNKTMGQSHEMFVGGINQMSTVCLAAPGKQQLLLQDLQEVAPSFRPALSR